jgi:hypothetical protein
MTWFDYRASQELEREDYSFAALIMAAMRRADNDNATKLREAWPALWEELDERYHAPGGYIGQECEGHTRLHCMACGWKGEFGVAYPTRFGCPQCRQHGSSLRYELVVSPSGSEERMNGGQEGKA